MISALFFYDAKGDVIMLKLYRAGVKRNIADVFRIQVITASSRHSRDVRLPVLTLGSTSFVYIRLGQLWFCAVTRSNQDCAAVLEFLYNLEELLRLVLGDKKLPLTPEVVTGSFSSVYDLLDEVVSFGYPTNLELNYLKGVTSVPSNDSKFKLPGRSNESKKIAVSPTVTWRNLGIKYRRNEIFLNVEEKVNVLMGPDSEVLRAYVDGAIKMKTHLSGMPECRFGLSDDSLLLNPYVKAPVLGGHVVLEDSKFHQCVDLTKFDMERVIQFIPPDGDFQLMLYHCVLNINLPFKVYSLVAQNQRKVTYKIRAKSLFPANIPATGVVFHIPAPKGVVKHFTNTTGGKAKFLAEDGGFVWRFNKFFGDLELEFSAEVELAEQANDFDDTSGPLAVWSRPPIKLDFTLEMFLSSGLTVKFLKVHEKANYRTVKWVKYLTHSGLYDIRF